MTRARGNCYKAAANLMITLNLNGGTDGATLVHGVVTGTGGEALGIRYSHAWVESEGEVFDLSNGNCWIVPREMYYNIGSIDAEECIRYNYEEMREELLRTEHYGPWDERVTININ